MATRNTIPAEADAAFLVGAVMARSNLAERLAACWAFEGLREPSHGGLALCPVLVKNMAGTCFTGSSSRLCNKNATYCAAYRVVHLIDREGTEFMASFDTTTEKGRHGEARRLSVANGPALAWSQRCQEEEDMF